jgi:tetratricopeptide (TPR) repeat protein
LTEKLFEVSERKRITNIQEPMTNTNEENMKQKFEYIVIIVLALFLAFGVSAQEEPAWTQQALDESIDCGTHSGEAWGLWSITYLENYHDAAAQAALVCAEANGFNNYSNAINLMLNPLPQGVTHDMCADVAFTSYTDRLIPVCEPLMMQDFGALLFILDVHIINKRYDTALELLARAETEGIYEPPLQDEFFYWGTYAELYANTGEYELAVEATDEMLRIAAMPDSMWSEESARFEKGEILITIAAAGNEGALEASMVEYRQVLHLSDCSEIRMNQIIREYGDAGFGLTGATVALQMECNVPVPFMALALAYGNLPDEALYQISLYTGGTEIVWASVGGEYLTVLMDTYALMGDDAMFAQAQAEYDRRYPDFRGPEPFGILGS